VVVIDCLARGRENEDVEDGTNIEPSESPPTELGQRGQNPKIKRNETKLNAGNADLSPRAQGAIYGTRRIDATGVKWKGGRRSRGAEHSHSTPRGISNLATSANSACREPLVIMEEEASIHPEKGAFNRLPPNVIER
jgi:hypothetical protein